MSGLPDQIGVALLVGDALERGRAAWMVGGSIASSMYGEPRTTHDVDLVSDLLPSGVGAFLSALGDTFYADREAVVEATRLRRCFNTIHTETTDKIDVFCVGTPFARRCLDRRQAVTLGDGRRSPVAAPESIVVEKRRWFRLGGEVSERQPRDVVGVLQVVGAQLDRNEMLTWAEQLGVSDLLQLAMKQAGLDLRA